MKLYRSLIFRELKLTRNRRLLMLLLFGLLSLLMLTPIMIGDRSEPGEESPAEMVLLLVGTVALTGGVLAGANNGLQKADISVGWKRYSFVLPPTAKQQALSGLLVKLCYILFFGLLSAGFAWLYTIAANYNAFGIMLNIYLGAVCAGMLFAVVYIYIIMFAKTKKDLGIIGAIASVGTVLLLVALNVLTDLIKLPEQPAEGGALISDEQFNRLMTALTSHKTTLCIFAAFAVLCAVYFFVLWRSHERREP